MRKQAPPVTRLFALLSLVVALASLSPGAPRAKEKEVDPSYLAVKDCPSEPGCAAIILLDETELSNDSAQARVSHHRLIKVFTEEGISKYADVEVYAEVSSDDIRNLAGRTILPDGTVQQLKQENIFVKTAIKQGRNRVRTKTAKFPGVVPGAIIDVSYDLISPGAANYASYTWDIQWDLPVLDAKLSMRPGEMPFQVMPVGTQHVDVTRASPFKYITNFTAKNVPSIPKEPFGPPEEVTRARMQFYLSELQATWLAEMAGRIGGATGYFIGDAQAVHAKMKELVSDQDPTIEKVKKLYRFVQEKIGTEEDRGGQTDDAQVKDPNNVDEVLKRGYGDEGDRTLLFVALAREAGLPAAVLLITPRDKTVLNTDLPDVDQFGDFAAAVKTGDSSWTFYDPAVKHCPFGMISANKEGGVPNAIMIMPQKGAGERYRSVIANTAIMRNKVMGYSLAAIPFSAASKNVLNREANVRLAQDGTAEVQVSEQGTGLVDLDHRNRYERLDDEKRRAELTERIQRISPRAQLVSADFVDIDSFEKPASIKYGFKLPEAAAGAANQIILTPSLFDASSPTPFTAEKRLTTVNLPHTQKTVEKITFELPADYEIGDLPRAAIVREGPFLFVTNYSKDGSHLVFSRRLEIDAAVWSIDGYPQLKRFFEKVQESDRQVVILKKGAA